MDIPKGLILEIGGGSTKIVYYNRRNMLNYATLPFGAVTLTDLFAGDCTPEEAAAFARLAQENGIEVIIAAAGKAAHLGGVLAAYTVLPVIGLPIAASQLDGMDALLAIVQMPAGIPVATVAINGAQNAALLAAQILAVKYGDIRAKLERNRTQMHDDVLMHDAEIASRVAEIVKGE